MKINITHIPPDGYNIQFTEKADYYHVLSDMIRHKEIIFTEPLTVDISAHVISETLVEVKGKISTAFFLNCSRCLESFEQKLTGSFNFNFVQINDNEQQPDDEDGEYEILDKDINTEYFTGDIIELDEIIQEQVVVNLPVNPLCKESCKGLCPGCGKDLNSFSCSCSRPEGHPAFAALKSLKI